MNIYEKLSHGFDYSVTIIFGGHGHDFFFKNSTILNSFCFRSCCFQVELQNSSLYITSLQHFVIPK